MQPEDERSSALTGSLQAGDDGLKGSRRGRPPIDAQARRDRLLRAAARMCNASGMDAVRMEDIGAAEGFSKIPLYRAFETKDALLDAMLGAARDMFAQALADDGSSLKTALERLLAAIRAEPDMAVALLRTSCNHPRYGQYSSGAFALIASRLIPLMPHPTHGFARQTADALAIMLVVATLYQVHGAPPEQDAHFLTWALGMVTASNQLVASLQPSLAAH